MENIEYRVVRLIEARISSRRSQNLEARFCVIEPAEVKELFVSFDHRGKHKAHSTTIEKLIINSLDWSNPPDLSGYRISDLQPVFLIPQAGEGFILDDTDYWMFLGFESRRPYGRIYPMSP